MLPAKMPLIVTVGSDHEGDWRAARRQAKRAADARRLRRALLLAVLALVIVGGSALAAVLLDRGGSPVRHPAASAAEPRPTPLKPAAVRPHTAAHARTARRRKPGTETVPILMYHVIAPPLATAPYPGLYVPPAEFAAQMRGARTRRLSRGHPRPGARLLAPRHASAWAADRAELRQRLPHPVHAGAPDAAPNSIGSATKTSN